MLMQAQHDADAAELVQALRAAACIAMLALSPSERVPHQVDCLACLTQSLQVADLLLHHMLHHTQYSKCCMLQRQLMQQIALAQQLCRMLRLFEAAAL